jgi:hypothetical protein
MTVLWMASSDNGMMTGAIFNFDQSIWGAFDEAPVPERALET